MVARSFSGISSNLIIIWFDRAFEFLIRLNSAGVSEKNAASEPDIMAEIISIRMMANSDITKFAVKGLTVKFNAEFINSG
jgi:hypothetical protein